MPYESFLDNARLERCKERLAAEAAAKQELIALVELYGVLCDNYELQPDNHSSKALKDFLAKHPNVAGDRIGVDSEELAEKRHLQRRRPDLQRGSR